MGLNWPGLKLDSGSSGFVLKSMAEILTDLSVINDDSVKVMKLNNYVHVMEDELRKIDAFKRELPFCTRLLNDAVERLKEERVRCMGKKVGPVMMEFLPLKGSSEEDRGAKWSVDDADKKKWMSSAQLWTAGTQIEPLTREQNFGVTPKSSEKVSVGCEFESPFGESFLAFKGQPGQTNELLPYYGPSMLASAGSPDLDPKVKRISQPSFQVKKSQEKPEDESSKKLRRCWSLELHRLFVEALQQLGGAHKATPKQIKEKMNIDGLTANEIKSHLQKYRIHLSKVCPRTRFLIAPSSYVKGSSSKSGSPDGPFDTRESSKGASVSSVEEEDDVKSESRSGKDLFKKKFDQSN